MAGVISDLQVLKDPKKAADSVRFYQTDKGGYGEGDQFLGIVVPKQRKISRKYKDLSLPELQELLDSQFHECRSVALMILVLQYRKGNPEKHQQIVDLYLKNSKKIDNWDLVDMSAPYILGDWFLDRDRNILYEYAKSENLWQKRIAMLSTYGFIRKNQYEDTIKIAEILLNDKHDLIHKAVGWMLREVGKRDQAEEEKFLKKYYREMPRTMLRYAIEKFPESIRQKYLKGEI